MLQQPMKEKLHALRLHGMIEAIERQEQDEAARELGFLDRLALLIDQQWNWQENQALARRVKASRLRGAACVEDIDYRAERGLNQECDPCTDPRVRVGEEPRTHFRARTNRCRKELRSFGTRAESLPRWLCRLLHRAAALFRDLNLARADGSLRQLLKRLNRIDVLVVDDWAMAPMLESERRDFWEIAEDRYQTRSMILTSQLPVSRWHEQIGDPTLADGILDRLVHNAHRIEMRGESMRKHRGEKGAEMTNDRRGKSCGKAGQKAPLEIAKRFSLSHSFGDGASSLDDRDHFLENPTASVASLRRLITSIPER